MNALTNFGLINDADSTGEEQISILIVDDDRDILHALRDILEIEDIPCSIEIAENISQALENAKNNCPDIAILDIKIGSENGLNLVPELKMINPDISCIMITAFRDSEYAVTALRFGAHDFIYKPIEPYKIIKTIENLVNNKKLQKERERFERRFETLFEQSRHWLFIVSESGILINANQTALDAIEYDTDPIQNIEFWNTPWFSSSSHAQEIIKNYFNNKPGNKLLSHNIKLSLDNNYGHYELSFTPIIDNKNNIDQISIQCRNITNQIQYEDKLNRFNNELERKVKERTMELGNTISMLEKEIENRKQAEIEIINQKNRAEKASHAKSEFLSRMSHELYTPLHAILGFGQLLELDNETTMSDSQQSNLHEIMTAGQHLLSMIDNILELSKMDKGGYNLQIQPLNIKDILNISLTSAQTTMKHQDFSFINQANDELVLADIAATKQVIDHILTISTRHNLNNGDIKISSQKTENDFLRLSFTDSGPGISHELCSNLFTPLEKLTTTMFELEGPGISMTVAQNLTKLMNGKIGVTSQPGQNTTFWLELPLQQD